MTEQTIAQVGEFPLIDSLVAPLSMGPQVQLGPGDDGAVVTIDGSMVVSVDLLIENSHFRRDWSSAHDVGRKAIAVNVADIEAMGAQPLTVVPICRCDGLASSWLVWPRRRSSRVSASSGETPPTVRSSASRSPSWGRRQGLPQCVATAPRWVTRWPTSVDWGTPPLVSTCSCTGSAGSNRGKGHTNADSTVPRQTQPGVSSTMCPDTGKPSSHSVIHNRRTVRVEWQLAPGRTP